MRRLVKIFYALLRGVALVATLGAIALWLVYEYYSQGLPDYTQLAAYDPPVTTRVYTGDGRLLAEYAIENRIFVPISAIPKRVIGAFLSAEDKTFYTHSGIDVPGLLSAIFTNIRNYGESRRLVGASTITQQVTKNFLLTNERSFARKIKEVILALRIERAYSKDRILELYLNQIYLGGGNYGVAAAALNYFAKPLDQLSVSEVAYLAALPKAPNNYDIAAHYDAAVDRRNWVIDRMLEDGRITEAEAAAAKAETLERRTRDVAEKFSAPYFAEEVRRELAARFGEAGLYKKGLTVKATIDPRLQEIADRVLRQHLAAYDRTQGYRGPLGHIDDPAHGIEALATQIEKEPMPWLYEWRRALVIAADKAALTIAFADGGEGKIPLAELTWARRRGADGKLGPAPKSAADALAIGDVIAVEAVDKDKDGKPYPAGTYGLRQVPELSGALVAMDPHTGRVLAMTGGWSYDMSEFNRATQANRQPGSSFKPIVYLAALEAGYTPATVILDAPIVIDQGPGLPLWRPENYEQEYLGPATMRVALERSRNLMTIRIAQAVGMDKVADVARRLGVDDNLQQTLAMSLGAGETTALRMAGAYAEIVNGGKKIVPTIIDRVQDNQGWTIYRHDARACDLCQGFAYDGAPPPKLPDTRDQVLDPGNAYQMVSMLQGVVDHGTGYAAHAIGKPVAGKTGTTNDGRDVWFVGFSPDLVVSVYLGFDQPKSLGGRATGGKLSAPIFRDFMIEALVDKPATPFRVPPGLRFIRVNKVTGERTTSDDPDGIVEAFKPGTEPLGMAAIVEGFGDYGQDAGYGSIIPIDPATGALNNGDSETSIIETGDLPPNLGQPNPAPNANGFPPATGPVSGPNPPPNSSTGGTSGGDSGGDSGGGLY